MGLSFISKPPTRREALLRGNTPFSIEDLELSDLQYDDNFIEVRKDEVLYLKIRKIDVSQVRASGRTIIISLGDNVTYELRFKNTVTPGEAVGRVFVALNNRAGDPFSIVSVEQSCTEENLKNITINLYNPRNGNVILNINGQEDGAIFRVRVKDVDGASVYSNEVQYSETVATINSLDSFGNLISEYTNAYEVTPFNYVILEVSGDEVVWSAAMPPSYVGLSSSPMTGIFYAYSMGLSPESGKYYRIGVKNSTGVIIYSGSYLYS